MRILTVGTSDRGGGAERSGWLHFDGYRRRGHDAWLAVGHKKSDDDRVLALHASPFVDYRPYGRASFRAGLAVARRTDRAVGLEDFRHPYSRHLLELAGAPPEVVHLHNLHGGYFDPRVVPTLCARVPVFLSLHDLWTLTGHCAHGGGCPRWRSGCGACPDLAAQPAIERDATRWNVARKARLWRRSRLRVLVPCEWMMRQIEGSILEPAIEEARIVRTPVDLEAFAPVGARGRAAAREALGIDGDVDVVLLVANLGLSNPLKDGDTAREAVQRLARRRERRRLELWVVGEDGPTEHHADHTVRYAGYVGQPERLALHYRAADVLLLSSRAELLPLVLTEALACGTPVVASSVGGIPELVRDGETGTTFTPGDAESAARALARAIEHPDEARAEAAAGGRIVRETFSCDAVVDRTLAWFEEAALADARRVDRTSGRIPRYGPRGAAVARVEAALHARPRLDRAARRVRHAPHLALHLAGRGVRRLGLAPRIGQLQQHAPRPLAIPPRYRAAPEPAAVLPLVSIVTPSLDQGRFLERTLASVAEQGYPALEHVVRDGGSRDETPRILEAWRDRLHHVASAPDGGQAAALNLGFERTSGEIMAWLNADDVLLPGALYFVARHFLEHPDVDVVYGHRVLIDADDREIGRWIVPQHDPAVLRWADFVPQETLFWRRRAWEKVGARLDERFRFAMDWDLLLRFQRAGLGIVRLPRFLAGFRVHAEQKTRAQAELGAAEMDRLRLRELGFRPRPEQVHRRLWRYYLRHLGLHAAWRMGLARF